MEEMRNAYKIFVGKPEVKIPLVESRCRQVDNIRKDLRDVWTGCILYRIMNSDGSL
jgi:hypothetical protein